MISDICKRLRIEAPLYVEIESKRRVLPQDVPRLREYLMGRKGLRHEKTALFFDQFLDTPDMDVFGAGASLRLRYKRNGARVYLQYKGPGFKSRGLLIRSEFSSDRLRHVLMEESHHDIVHFSDTSVRELLASHVEPEMARAMRCHLGERTLGRITAAQLLCIYQKEKFVMRLGDDAYLEPSLDRVFAFHIGRKGPHPLSTFCEYENEIKSEDGGLAAKLDRIPRLLDFDAALSRKFKMPLEPLDKYHRCASFFKNN